ncbi:hypothetical protein [Bradyrhizobium sp. USDA 3256]
MSRGVQAFKQTDVTKAAKAARNAGLSVHRIEIGRDGKIVVHTSEATDADPEKSSNEWDDVE